MKIATALIGTAALVILPQAAFASTSTSQNISTCSDEIRAQLGATASEADLDFKTVKGNSRVQTLSFRIDADGERDKVTCKVRRDNSVEVIWGKTVKPKMSKSVEAKADTTAGE